MTFFEEGFFMTIRSSVTKWWRVIYKPIYKLTHINSPSNTNIIQTKSNQLNSTNQNASEFYASEQTTNSANNNIMLEPAPSNNSIDADLILKSIRQKKDDTLEDIIQSAKFSNTNQEADNSNDAFSDDDALKRANEIFERLNKELSEDEAKKQAEIEEAKRLAREQDVINHVMNQNKIDISSYIDGNKK